METRRILVAYFSHSGNTREIADRIHECLGGDVFEITTVNPYPRDYNTVVKIARRELDNGHRPALASQIEDIGSYDVIFVGYPNWWGTVPTAVSAFLERYDFSGKTVIPFCTHGGGRMGRSVSDIAKLCPRSIIQDGLEVRGGETRNAQKKVLDWLRRIGMAPSGDII